jgi:hypothetical protein
MAKKQTELPSALPASSLPSPRSRREELLDALLANTVDPIHIRVLKAYKAGGSVEAAEQEFATIIEEILQ